MKKFIHLNRLMAGVTMAFATLMVTSCGDYFAPGLPDEYDPDELPSITKVPLNASYNLMVGEKIQLNPSSLTISNGKNMTQQSQSDRDYLMSSMLWSALHGDTIVKARAADLSVTAMARGEDVVSVITPDGVIGSCRFTVHDGTEPPTAILLGRSVIVLEEGMTYTIDYGVEPNYCENDGITCDTDNKDIAAVTPGGVVTAIGAGTAIITVYAEADPTVFNKLVVTVIPNWKNIRPDFWRYETVVYADILIDGERLVYSTIPMQAEPTSCEISLTALYGNDDYRGAGNTLTSHGITYTVFRVGNDNIDNSPFCFQGYDRAQQVLIDFDTTIPFDANVHGTLTAPITLKGTRRSN